MKNYIKIIIILLISAHLVDYAMDRPCYFDRLPDDAKAIVLRESWNSTYHEIRQLRSGIYKGHNAQERNIIEFSGLLATDANYNKDLADAKCCLYSFALVNKNWNKFFFDLQFKYLQSMTKVNENSSVEDILILLSTPRVPAISCPRSSFISVATLFGTSYSTSWKEVLSPYCFDFWHCLTKSRDLVNHVAAMRLGNNSCTLFFSDGIYTYMRLNGLIVAILKTDSEFFSEVLMKKYSIASTDKYKESDLSSAKNFLYFLLSKQLPKHEIFLEMHNKFCAEIV